VLEAHECRVIAPMATVWITLIKVLDPIRRAEQLVDIPGVLNSRAGVSAALASRQEDLRRPYIRHIIDTVCAAAAALAAASAVGVAAAGWHRHGSVGELRRIDKARMALAVVIEDRLIWPAAIAVRCR
jgi:hypothetical protein